MVEEEKREGVRRRREREGKGWLRVVGDDDVDTKLPS